MQTRVSADGGETYSAYRFKLLAPQALALGNINGTWNPGSDDFTVHTLKVYRNGQVIDVLATTKFQIVQRENNLDYAMLDGQLTATLQVPGLQVGDEIEFSATLRRRDPNMGGRSYGMMQLPVVGLPGANRARLTWPVDRSVQVRSTPDLGAGIAATRDGIRELSYVLNDPKSSVATDGAPMRFNVRRQVGFSSFASWGELSNQIFPLFEKAEAVAPNSPIRAEAGKIAAASEDPAVRVEAALALVQDRIRYVYVGLDGGNYRPAGADDTWTRRFGDCKAKTVLLLALLRQLGIQGEAVLVSSNGGDGTDQHLPSPQVFDHVLVRAVVGGKIVWLDGTRLGDHKLAAIDPPRFRWGLPLRGGPVNLEPIPAQPLPVPQRFTLINVDASTGFDAPAKYQIEERLHGDDVLQIRTQLSTLATEDAERMEKAFWKQDMASVEPASVAWRYDDQTNVLVLSMSGEGKPEWEGGDKNGHRLVIYHAGFSPPAEMHRPKEQDQAAPWLTDFPAYSCSATNIKLPQVKGWDWDFLAKPVNRKFGGATYWRRAVLHDGVMRTVMITQTYVPEISAAEAQAVNEQLPKFDNKMSQVFQFKHYRAAAPPGDDEADPKAIPPNSDWRAPAFACKPPSETKS